MAPSGAPRPPGGHQAFTNAYDLGYRWLETDVQISKDGVLYAIHDDNLKNITVDFPIGALSVVTGVSGSGKTSLVKGILCPAMLRYFDIYSQKPLAHTRISGDLNTLKSVEFVDQNPIGRSSRSNPVTYCKAYDEIRALFSKQKRAPIWMRKTGLEWLYRLLQQPKRVARIYSCLLYTSDAADE